MTPKQAAFVNYKLMGLSNRLAVIEAGYSGSGAKQRGTRLMKHPGVRAELRAGGLDVDFCKCGTGIGFQRAAGRWLAVSPSMPKRVYTSPIEFLTDGMNCRDLPNAMRIQFAKALLPYQHPRIGR